MTIDECMTCFYQQMYAERNPIIQLILLIFPRLNSITYVSHRQKAIIIDYKILLE